MKLAASVHPWDRRIVLMNCIADLCMGKPSFYNLGGVARLDKGRHEQVQLTACGQKWLAMEVLHTFALFSSAAKSQGTIS